MPNAGCRNPRDPPATVPSGHRRDPAIARPSPEDEILPTVRELGIGYVAYSPLGRGFLTGRFESPEDLPDDDWRRDNPRFRGENFRKNLELVDEVREIAGEKRVTPAQLALAWLLHREGPVVPIPGTTSPEHLEENAAALEIDLGEENLARIERAAPVGPPPGTATPT